MTYKLALSVPRKALNALAQFCLLGYVVMAIALLMGIVLIFINVPVPFIKGDLIEMSDGALGVLIDLPHWRTGEPWA